MGMKRLFLCTLLLLSYVTVQAQSGEEALAETSNYVNVSSQLSTSGQITYDQIPELKEAGYDLVVNLAPASDAMNALEGYLVVDEGMSYVQIPVSWQEPSMRDLKMFFDVMESNSDRKIYVHCFANMRASVFVYLYRTMVQDIPESEAMAHVQEVWNPADRPQWAALIESAQKEFSK